MAKRIAIVEDERDIAQNYSDALTARGYEVAIYSTQYDALSAFHSQLPDLALIDIGLGDDPDAGFELCRELRVMSPMLPIVFLSARDSELDVISGLRLGADDYLTKDTSMPHIMARIVALFRRVDALQKPQVQQQLMHRGPLEVDLERMQISWHGSMLELTVTEFWIIHALAKHPGHVRNRDQLMDAANVVLDSNTITSHIKRIRKKFQVVDSAFNQIETAYGMGYRWRS